MNACDDVIAALAPYAECSLDGDVARVRTHCLYPSFEPVFVTVDRTGAGSYVVSDTGAAYAVAWDAGRDHRTIERAILQSASRFDVGTQGASILVTVPSLDWLASAIVAVANASSNAATEAIRHVRAATEAELKERIDVALSAGLRPDLEVAHDYGVSGQSGKIHTFDFAVLDKRRRHLVLMDAVVPHHSSISHRFVAFSDAKAVSEGAFKTFAIYDQPLARDDAALIRQVADLVPVGTLVRGTERALPADLLRN